MVAGPILTLLLCAALLRCFNAQRHATLHGAQADQAFTFPEAGGIGREVRVIRPMKITQEPAIIRITLQDHHLRVLSPSILVSSLF